MRERSIKCRAWDKKRNCWNYAVLAFNADGELELDTPIPENYEVVEYTGLKDKNGAEIYEGDVLSWIAKSDDPEIVEMNQGILVVTWEYGMWRVAGGPRESLWKCIDDMKTESDSEWYEVIGNIYENPELLGADNVRKEDSDV